jgi:hypothetical protein
MENGGEVFNSFNDYICSGIIRVIMVELSTFIGNPSYSSDMESLLNFVTLSIYYFIIHSSRNTSLLFNSLPASINMQYILSAMFENLQIQSEDPQV